MSDANDESQRWLVSVSEDKAMRGRFTITLVACAEEGEGALPDTLDDAMQVARKRLGDMLSRKAEVARKEFDWFKRLAEEVTR